MQQVKIYDDSDNLKKVISVKALQKRSDILIESPSFYRKTQKNSKPPAKINKIRNRRRK